MIDIELFREDPKKFEEEIKKRGMKIDISAGVLLDSQWRELTFKVDELRAKKNEASKNIPRLEGKDRDRTIKEMKGTNVELEELEARLEDIKKQYKIHFAAYPNLSHKDIPVGPDESGNIVRSYNNEKPVFDFAPRNHIELGTGLDILDEKRAAKVSGSRFVYIKNEGVMLEFALIQYVLNKLIGKGFIPMITPALVNEKAMYGTGFFPVEASQYYKTELDDLYLIGTSEVPLCAYHSGEFLDVRKLPLKYTAFSTCFRREAGTYGKDMGGMFRVHQFDKIEMLIFAHPDNSWDEYEVLLETLEEIMKGLGFHYRIMDMCTGDIGAPNARKYDLEAWLPGQQNYRELASCSHDSDFQSRRLNIKYKDGKNKALVHTMNSTACAIGRTLIAIYENYQNSDGSITVPEVLMPYMGGIKKISRENSS